MKDFNLTDFINSYVVYRNESLFTEDIANCTEALNNGIYGKSILVIGGAGSIGSSYIKQVIKYEPSELFVVDTNENALTELIRDLRCSGVSLPKKITTYPMDYNSSTFQHMFSNHVSGAKKGFDIVSNFSAHKHVRSEKDIYSTEALIRNNIINAKRLLDLLEHFPPKQYFCVSTDKAANPVNIMGASKRIMEDLIFSYSSSFTVRTARFANVAFSNGSLPDSFLKRLSLGQPITAPTDTKRYFVSPEESGQICMLATIFGDNRDIFFPKLDSAKMQTFDKIAVNLLENMGYKIEFCSSDKEAIEKSLKRSESDPYPVFFSESDTSGEKKYEEFYIEGEKVDLTTFKSLGIIKDKQIPDKYRVIGLIDSLEKAFDGSVCTKSDVVKILSEYLPNFEHIETGKNLDEKM